MATLNIHSSASSFALYWLVFLHKPSTLKPLAMSLYQEEVITVKWGHKGRALIWQDYSLIRGNDSNLSLSFFIPSFPPPLFLSLSSLLPPPLALFLLPFSETVKSCHLQTKKTTFTEIQLSWHFDLQLLITNCCCGRHPDRLFCYGIPSWRIHFHLFWSQSSESALFLKLSNGSQDYDSGLRAWAN